MGVNTTEARSTRLRFTCSKESQRRYERETGDPERREEQRQALGLQGGPWGRMTVLGVAGWGHVCPISHKTPLSTKHSPPEKFHEETCLSINV